MSSQSQNSVSSVPVASAVPASGPVTSGTPSAANSQTANAAPTAVVPVAAGLGKNVFNRGKGGKLGGKGNALRHTGMGKPGISGYSRPRQRRVASRAGVKMICKDVFEPNDDMLEEFTMEFVKNALCYAMHARRKTLVKIDCLAAFKRMGRTVYSTSDN
jgi:histone H3/H4